MTAQLNCTVSRVHAVSLSQKANVFKLILNWSHLLIITTSLSHTCTIASSWWTGDLSSFFKLGHRFTAPQPPPVFHHKVSEGSCSTCLYMKPWDVNKSTPLYSFACAYVFILCAVFSFLMFFSSFPFFLFLAQKKKKLISVLFCSHGFTLSKKKKREFNASVLEDLACFSACHWTDERQHNYTLFPTELR